MIGKRVNVLDKGWIELEDMMGNDQSIVDAARTSYLGKSKGDEADKQLLFSLMKKSHSTPFEMVEFRFKIHAPMIVMAQWVRHRTWSYNSRSARYSAFSDNDFYIPEWQGDVEHINLVDAALKEHYIRCFKTYELTLECGVSKEQARLFLPGFAMYYTWIAKVDAHNLMHFLKLRMASSAQYEIRQYANAIYQEFFKPMLPWTAEAFERYKLL